MGHRELEAALRREGESKARAIWQQVEAEAVRLRAEQAERLQREQLNNQQRLSTERAALLEAAQVTAQQRAQRQRLAAEQQLAERLRALAESLLAELSQADGPELFNRLAAEIPEHSWREVRVNPRDTEAARSCFPQSEIQPDADLRGGLIVRDQSGRIMIINTLEKRLAHLWPELLPELMNRFRQRGER